MSNFNLKVFGGITNGKKKRFLTESDIEIVYSSQPVDFDKTYNKALWHSEYNPAEDIYFGVYNPSVKLADRENSLNSLNSSVFLFINGVPGKAPISNTFTIKLSFPLFDDWEDVTESDDFSFTGLTKRYNLLNGLDGLSWEDINHESFSVNFTNTTLYFCEDSETTWKNIPQEFLIKNGYVYANPGWVQKYTNISNSAYIIYTIEINEILQTVTTLKDRILSWISGFIPGLKK